jgi:acyl-coenzyme A thioesterase PaaI-like protein
MLSLVLEEEIAHAEKRSRVHAPTEEMTVRFRRPAPIGGPLRLTATRPEGRRLLTCRAEARDADGALIAEATGKFLRSKEGPE